NTNDPRNTNDLKDINNSEDTNDSKNTTDSKDFGIVIRLITFGTSFSSWISFEKSLEHYSKKNKFKPIKS
ncbi:13376_t:CDS:1, partial [Cetraspora pellucida]